jgi:hypothetical protein
VIAREPERPERCCCGKRYSSSGGESSEYCPAGARNLCAECASDGKGRCPTHNVPTRS